MAAACGACSRAQRAGRAAVRGILVIRWRSAPGSARGERKDREEKRFSRYDKNKDGKVEADEYLAARRRNFDKLDLDHSGTLSFSEYAAKGIEKFNTAGGRKGWLTPVEFVATAPPRAKHKAACSCRAPAPEVVQADDNNENN